jgi:hypothetical protein
VSSFCAEIAGQFASPAGMNRPGNACPAVLDSIEDPRQVPAITAKAHRFG